MKKLSELAMDDMICSGVAFLTKEEYLENMSLKYAEPYNIYDTEVDTIDYRMSDLFNSFERYDDVVHEDWLEIVCDELEDIPEIKKAVEIINKVFKSNPTYYQGNRIIDDMTGGM